MSNGRAYFDTVPATLRFMRDVRSMLHAKGYVNGRVGYFCREATKSGRTRHEVRWFLS